MPDALCVDCERPVPDLAYLCPRCGGDLARALHTLVDVADDMIVTLTRQDRIGATTAPVTRGDDAQPLPYHHGASEVTWVTRNTLTTWVRFVTDTRGLAPPDDTIPAMAQFLTGSVTWLRHRPEAGEALGELLAAARSVLRVIDSPPPFRFAGICSADGTRLYAPERAAVARCPECAGEVDVDDQHAALVLLLEDQLSYAEEIAQGLSNLGRAANVNTIRSWARRGRLVIRARDRADRPLYRVGDVLDLLRDPDGRAHRVVTA